MRWCARLRAATAPATVVTRHGGGELSGPAERRLGYGNEREEEGEWKSSSQGLRRWPRGARGGTGADEFDEDGRRVRGRRRRRWRRCRASGGLWIGGEEEGVEAELLGASARLGVAGGHGYGDDDGELRSVAGGETEERGGGRSRERGRSERGSGRRVASPGVEEGGNQAGGGQGGSRRWPRPLGRAPRLCSSSWQRRKKTRGRRWAGPARWAGQLGQVSGAR